MSGDGLGDKERYNLLFLFFLLFGTLERLRGTIDARAADAKNVGEVTTWTKMLDPGDVPRGADQPETYPPTGVFAQGEATPSQQETFMQKRIMLVPFLSTSNQPSI